MHWGKSGKAFMGFVFLLSERFAGHSPMRQSQIDGFQDNCPERLPDVDDCSRLFWYQHRASPPGRIFKTLPPPP
jgi:hypothetical protein